MRSRIKEKKNELKFVAIHDDALQWCRNTLCYPVTSICASCAGFSCVFSAADIDRFMVKSSSALVGWENFWLVSIHH